MLRGEMYSSDGGEGDSAGIERQREHVRRNGWTALTRLGSHGEHQQDRTQRPMTDEHTITTAVIEAVFFLNCYKGVG